MLHKIYQWQNLKQYSVMDELRNQLKTMNRQFGFYMKHKTAMKNNLIGILDQTYPGVNTYFDSPARSDGSQKWVDFASTYWHVDCIRKMSLNAFIDHYQNWCKRKKYNFSQSKAEEIYGKAKELVPVLPKDVYMTAGANKFLRIYYGRVKEYLSSLPES